jgi:hypothetical protein
MNWTSTQVPLWQIDCDAFRQVGRAFELRDVTSVEHYEFETAFCARYDWVSKRSGTTVLFSSPPKK